MSKELSLFALSVNPSATVEIDTLYKQMLANGADVVGFGAGEPDFNTPDNIKRAAIQAIENNFTKYTPAAGIMKLRQAICEKIEESTGLKYKPSQIITSSGAKHNLFLTLKCLINPGDEVILPAPYWVSYIEMVKMCGGVPVILDADIKSGFRFPAIKLSEKITPKTKVLILNSPSNPAGTILSKEELTAIAHICVKNDIYVISDEIYNELIYDYGIFTSIASLGEEIKDLTIMVNGFSKAYAMTGWRIGYSASNDRIARVIANYQSNSTGAPCSISQMAALEALTGPQDAVENMRREFEKRRNLMCSELDKIDGVSYIKPSGAFYVAVNIQKLCGNGGHFEDSDDFAKRLLNEGLVAVVPCSSFGLPGFVRLSFAVSEENIIKGIRRIGTFIDKVCVRQ